MGTQLLKISMDKLPAIIAWSFAQNMPVYVHGASGIGKSQGMRQYAREWAEAKGLTFWDFKGGSPENMDRDKTFCWIDLRVVLMDILDVKGGPMLDKEEMVTRFLASSILPDTGRHAKYGCLFLDELPQGAPMVTNGLSQLVYDRHIGDSYFFPKDWRLLAAGNRKQDAANTNKVGAQIYNRFSHFELVADVEAWARHMLGKGGDFRIPNFVRLRPELFHMFEKGDICFPSPRLWEEVDKVVRTVEDKALREMFIGGLVSEGVAVEVCSYLDIHTQIETFPKIVRDPLKAKVPEAGVEGSVAACYAVIGMCVGGVTETNIDAVFAYVNRLPEEFQAVFAIDIISAKPELQETVAFTKWRQDHPSVRV